MCGGRARVEAERRGRASERAGGTKSTTQPHVFFLCLFSLALYPIDTIKTRLQLMRSGGGLRALLQAGGGRALYTGVWGNLAGVMPASAIFMGVYEPIKRRVADQAPPGREWLGPLIAGATAGVAASVVRVPTEVVKQRMQSGEFGGAAIGAVRSIVAREGVRGMFAGYGSFLLRDIPFDAIEFVAYEQLKRAYAATLKGREVNAAEVSAIGALWVFCFFLIRGEGRGGGADRGCAAGARTARKASLDPCPVHLTPQTPSKHTLITQAQRRARSPAW